MSFWNVITGWLSGGASRAVGVSANSAPGANASGALQVEIDGSNTSAFGDIIVAESTPLYQYDFIQAGSSSTFNSQIMTQAANGVGASATVVRSRLCLQSGTAAANTVWHKSAKVGRYRAGEGITQRFTFLFTAAASGSVLMAGAANTGTETPSDGYFFANVESAFGILHRCQFFTDQAASLVTTTTGTQAASATTINVTSTAGFPSAGVVFLASTYGVQSISYGAKTPSSFTGCTGGIGGAATLAAGSQAASPAYFDHFTPKSSWNVDRCDGSGNAFNPSGYTLDPTKLQVAQIRYPYLGAGDVTFWVQNGANGRWILCHIIQYAGANTEVQLGNASLNFFAGGQNFYGATTSTTNLTVYIGSVAALLSGKRVYTGPEFAIDCPVKNTTATEAPYITVANAAWVNGTANRGMLRLRSLSLINTTAANGALVRMRKTQQLGAGLAYAAVNGTIVSAPTASSAASSVMSAAQSVSFVDTSATAFAATPPVTGTSNVIWNFSVGPNASTTIDMTPFDIFVVPGDFITLSGVNAGGAAGIAMSLNWQEDT